MTEGTLVYMFKGDDVLLAMKKRGFGAGKWNGPGGKIVPGETPTEAAIRETQEELGVTPVLGAPLGRIQYHDPLHGDWTVHVFRTDAWHGTPAESEEMRPQWFGISKIPYASMWPGDERWMPLVIAGTPFSADLWFDGQQQLTSSDIHTTP